MVAQPYDGEPFFAWFAPTLDVTAYPDHSRVQGFLKSSNLISGMSYVYNVGIFVRIFKKDASNTYLKNIVC